MEKKFNFSAGDKIVVHEKSEITVAPNNTGEDVTLGVGYLDQGTHDEKRVGLFLREDGALSVYLPHATMVFRADLAPEEYRVVKRGE
jgi:hypothetical protein